MIDRLALILSANTAQKLLLSSWNSKPIKCFLNISRNFIPRMRSLLRRIQKISILIEIYLRQVTAPSRHRLFAEYIQSFQTKIAHPSRLILHSRNLRNNRAIQTFSCLEHETLRVVEPIFLLVTLVQNFKAAHFTKAP